MKNINPNQPIKKLVFSFSLAGILFVLLSASKPMLLDENVIFMGVPDIMGLNKKAEVARQNPASDKKAEFPGGRQALNVYLDDNFQVPKIAFKLKNQEVLIGAQMELQIGADGSASLLKLSDLRVQPKDPAIKQAVKTEFNRFVAQMPKWTPALKNGRAVVTTDTLGFITGFAPDVTYEDYISLKNKKRAEREKSPSVTEDLRTKDGKKVFTFAQKGAIFPGGEAALKAYITQNLKSLPALRQSAGNLVVLDIIINEKGIAEDLLVLKPKGATLNPAEVASALSQMPTWTPGKQNNKPIPYKYTLPIR